MKLHRVQAVGIVATIATALSAQPAAAALPTPASGVIWAQNQRVEYRWKDGAEPPGWAKTAMNAAAADNNSSRKAKAGVFAYAAAGQSSLAYTDDLPTNWAIGYTTSRIPDYFTIKMRAHGTVLDWGTLRWCEFYSGDPPNGCYDMEMVTLHEFGHAQTLDHVDEASIDSYTDSLMHAAGLHSKAKLGWNQHVYGRCDVARLQIRYQPLTTSTPISTCLDLDTALTLTPPTSGIDYGNTVTLTARLRVADDVVYPNLAGLLLAGRNVVLQRRAVGAGAWTSVGEMTPVTDETGRYVKSMTLTTTYDWRAVFAAPNDEGLNGATSSVSRLSVTYDCTPAGGSKYVPTIETC